MANHALEVRNSHYSANQAFLKLSADMAICCFAHFTYLSKHLSLS